GRGRHDLVTGADLAHDVEVGFEPQQHRERAPHHGLVLGEQDADHDSGAEAMRANPSVPARVRTVPPSRSRRSVRPRRPWPVVDSTVDTVDTVDVLDTVDGPSSTMASRTVSPSRVTSISHRRAPLCRITLVTPSRTVQANASSTGAGRSSVLPRTETSIPASVSADWASTREVASVSDRYPVTASRTSLRARRPMV